MADDKVEVTVTVDEDARAGIGALAERLSAKGLEGAASLASIGVISGTAARASLAALRDEPGVKAVEVAGGVQLPPPTSEIQ